jgi:hypothetical protein
MFEIMGDCGHVPCLTWTFLPTCSFNLVPKVLVVGSNPNYVWKKKWRILNLT